MWSSSFPSAPFVQNDDSPNKTVLKRRVMQPPDTLALKEQAEHNSENLIESPPADLDISPLATFKILVCGSGASGCTSLVRTWKHTATSSIYIPTVGVEIHKILVKTSMGDVLVNAWDCAGQERVGGLRDGYFIGAQGAIIVVVDETYDSTCTPLARGIRRVCDDIPIAVAVNGVRGDVPKVELPLKNFPDLPAVDVSTNLGWNVNVPLGIVLRQLLHNDSLQILG
eukprot:PhF_6_TR21078/c0_g1_i1/m.30378/K07936/RAN; GTP-binding nuclear protein Ran